MTAGLNCDGVTDDTAALQNILSNFNAPGGGHLVVPFTGNLCYIAGYSSTFTGTLTSSGGSVTITPTVNAKALTNIQYQMDYTSNPSTGAGSMQYNLHVRLEGM